MTLSDDIRLRRQTLQDLQDSILGVSHSVSILTGSATAGAGGKNYTVDFVALPDGAFTAAPFDLNYLSGPGPNGGLYLNSSGAAMATVSGYFTDVIALYHNSSDTLTNGDNQTLTTVLLSPMGPGALNYGLLRANTVGTTYVYAVGYQSTATSYTCQLGCNVLGTFTTFVVANIPYNTQLKFRAGVGANPYRFQVFAGATLIIDYIDNANVSQLGAGFRRWGFRSATSTDGNQSPAPASLVCCVDDAS
jgi:hypothetical protein